MIGFMFIQHGTEKLWGFPSGRIDHNFLSLHGFAGLLEFPGGILMMLGLFTRPTSFILSGQMAVAYWARWAPRGFWRSLIVGEASIYLFRFPVDGCNLRRSLESRSCLEPRTRSG